MGGDYLSVFSDPNVMLAAWKRTESWYVGGEGIPQPEFAAWQLNKDGWLERLSGLLESGKYTPRRMPLVPYPKAGIQIRHYCQPTVGDQIAFMAFSLLLAPVLEAGMENASFGNRWYRGITRTPGRWEFRKWSLDDCRPYQPYSRAHGLFRRVASWTVASMQDHRRGWSQSTEQTPEELPDGLLPHTASREFWKDREPVDKVCWARFDLKLAFPSVRLGVLRERVMDMLDRVVWESDEPSIFAKFSTLTLEDNLELYGDKIRDVLTDRRQVKLLADYLLRALESVAYRPYENSDEYCFGSSDDRINPPLLPRGDGATHPGLPTGLCASPLLLNAYLHPVDSEMVSWFRENRSGAYYRFADDIILLADSPKRLAEGIELLSKSILAPGTDGKESNLRINWDKVKPSSLSAALRQRKKTLSGVPLRNLSAKKGVLSAISAVAVTKSRNPFITDLVECLSDLGTDREADALAENAISRIARLREIVFLRPDDEAVPRSTQLIFAANQLTRTWLPELGESQDCETIASIREAVSEAVHGAPDKPRLWRSVVRAAVRRSFPGAQGIEEEKAARAWLHAQAAKYRLEGDGEWLLNTEDIAEGKKIDLSTWRNFSVFHRASLWRAVSEVSQDLSAGVRRIDRQEEMAAPESWLFRAFDEVSIRKAEEGLEKAAAELITTLYGNVRNPLTRWEVSPFAVAMMSFVPSVIVAHSFDKLEAGREPRFYKTVARLLRDSGAQWNRAAEVLEQLQERSLRTATLPRLLALCKRVKGDEEAVASALSRRCHNLFALLRFTDEFRVQHFLSDRRPQIYSEIINGHESRLEIARKRGPWSVARELERYERGRRIWIGLL